MKILPKEFVLTDFDREEGTDVLKYHYPLDHRLMNDWDYLVIVENDWEVFDEIDTNLLPHLPKISYKEWKEIVSQETLPEKWFIYVTEETRDVLNNWRNTVATNYLHDTINFAFGNLGKLRMYSHDILGDGSFCDECDFEDNHKDYTEITFEQFKKFVLKESDVPVMEADEFVNISNITVSKSHIKALYTVDNNQLCELYDNANKDGKEYLERLFYTWNVFVKSFPLNNLDIDFLRGCVNKEVCDKIFGEQFVDFDKLQVGSKVELKDGTIGRIIILKSKHFMTGHLLKLKRVICESWDMTTILTNDEIFRKLDYDTFLKEIKTVIEY